MKHYQRFFVSGRIVVSAFPMAAPANWTQQSLTLTLDEFKYVSRGLNLELGIDTLLIYANSPLFFVHTWWIFKVIS